MLEWPHGPECLECRLAGTDEESWSHRIARELREFYSQECEFCRIRRERVWSRLSKDQRADPAIVDWERRRTAWFREQADRELRRISSADLRTQREYLSRRAIEVHHGLFGEDNDSQQLLLDDGIATIAIIDKELEHRAWLDKQGNVQLARNQITRQNLDDIRSRFDLIEYIGATEGRQVRRTGNRATALCPFHAEKTPSLSIWQTNYYCFGCGEHGDIFDWVRERQGLDWIHAVGECARWANVKLPGR